MKMNLAQRVCYISIVIASSLSTTSCSSLWSHRDSAERPNPAAKSSTVSRDQYEELSRKYQELLSQSTAKVSIPEAPVKVVEAPIAAASTATEQLKPEVAQSTTIDPSELVNHIDSAIPDQKPIEGVDVLGSEGKMAEIKKSGPPVPDSMGVQHVTFTDDVDDQIVKLREAADLVKVNKFENALVLLKELENSKEKQIVVRAKVMLGDLLFAQGEFDLAMQVYEEIIKRHAFSGYVLKALGRLVACSEKLKQPEKQAKYYSLLHDFFEAV